jgi:hypothetical protein
VRHSLSGNGGVERAVWSVQTSIRAQYSPISWGPREFHSWVHGFTGSVYTLTRGDTHRDETRMTSYDINGLDRNHCTLILTYMKQLTACIEVRRTAYKRAISPTAPVNLGSFRGNLPAIQTKLEILMGPQD